MTDHSVVLSDGETVPSELTIWATGVTVHSEVEGWDVPQGHGGRIAVGDDLSVNGRDRVYAAGDIADSPADLPQLAQPAIPGRRPHR